MRELSNLSGMQVIAVDEGKRLGTISQALVDLAAGELVAVVLSGPPGKSLIMSRDFKVVGQDALMVDSARVLKSRAEVESDLARAREVLANPPTVITDKGTRLGTLANVMLADDGRTVVRYGISGGPLRDVATGPTALPILKGTVHGQDTIIVPHDAAHKYLAEASGGIKGGLEKLSKVFRQKYSAISERSGELYRESEERLRASTAKARQRAEELIEDARQKVKEVTQPEEQRGTEAETETEECCEQFGAEGQEGGEEPQEPDLEASKQELRATRGSCDHNADEKAEQA